ncbi:MAG: S41 family peptidase [Gammaproteobacteria bacterium]
MRKILLTSPLAILLLFANLSFAQTSNSQAYQPQDEPPLEDIQRFTTAISHIKSYYVKDTEDKKLFENAIRGMLEGLDPHSAYLDADDFKELNESTQGEFSGLGIEVTMENGYIKVITPIDDTPAARAGVEAGDHIIFLDKEPVKGMTLREAVNKMRGKRGSEITLTILREGDTKPLLIKVKRDIIVVKSIKSRLIDNKYAYIRISHFQAHTAEDLVKALDDLKRQAKHKLAGLILDLRNNPGGLLDSAIDVSDAFLDNKTQTQEQLIVYTKGRIAGSEFSARSKPGDLMAGAPIIVLINEGSASGSEIVAGALQDHKRAVLLGTRTFGKGSVQTVLPLDSHRGIKLTTALYYTPKGRSIQATGIVPDIEIKNVKIPKDKAAKHTWFNVTESNLKGHLTNGDGKNKTDNKNAPTTNQTTASKVKSDKEKQEGELIHQDFQLYQAVNMLKGLVVLHRN